MELLKTILSVIISLSTVLTIFTGIVNTLFDKKLKPIDEKIEKNRKDSIREDMHMARYQVVKFASELRRGVKKTRYEFEAVAEFADSYETAVKELGITNNFFTAEEEFIKQCYQKLCEEELNKK